MKMRISDLFNVGCLTSLVLRYGSAWSSLWTAQTSWSAQNRIQLTDGVVEGVLLCAKHHRYLAFSEAE